jgi:hypothetical protein
MIGAAVLVGYALTVWAAQRTRGLDTALSAPLS